MTPKEKAKELVNKYLAIQFGDFPTTDAKQCALIAIKEIQEAMELPSHEYKYWEQVEQEIPKL